MRTYAVLIAVTIFTMVGSIAFAQGTPPSKAGVIGSAHDPNGNGCGTCHAPHNGSVATGGPSQATGQILLWNRAFSSQTFGVYDSPTMDNKTVEIGGTPLANTEARMYSLLCMSCHDGVTTPSLIGPNQEAAVGNVANSYGLTNDHPINMDYDPTKDTGLLSLTTAQNAGLKFYGASDTVQCATCHNPHTPTPDPFLRVSNAGSDLCLSCHR